MIVFVLFLLIVAQALSLRRAFVRIGYLERGQSGAFTGVFASDMVQLERIYRVSSVLGLGILLLLTSYLYNRPRRA